MSDTVKWMDALEIGVEGLGWRDTDSPYRRLPAKAEKMVPEAVWNHSHSSTGVCLSFKTNATEIHARWTVAREKLGEPNFQVTSYSGVDLYADDSGTWRWAGSTRTLEGMDLCAKVIDEMSGEERAFRLYFPLQNPVTKLEIGVPDTADFIPIPPRQQRPIVFYGTSIVHGAYASHAGIIHPSILGRRLNRPVINLGFAGVGKMEIELAELLAEIDAEMYVLDTLPNMGLDLVNERAEDFVRRLRELQPDTPIVMVEDRPFTNAWIRPSWQKGHEEKWARYWEIYESLVSDGVGNLHYIEGRDLFGTDSEASLDSSHPSDLGYMRMANVVEPVLRAILD